jgi:glycine cleavage system protein P-like pyridoxal-binding family
MDRTMRRKKIATMAAVAARHPLLPPEVREGICALCEEVSELTERVAGMELNRVLGGANAEGR